MKLYQTERDVQLSDDYTKIFNSGLYMRMRTMSKGGDWREYDFEIEEYVMIDEIEILEDKYQKFYAQYEETVSKRFC